MIGAIVAAALCAPFSIGHIDRHGNEPQSAAFHHCGRIAMAVPPRTVVADESNHLWLYVTKVTTEDGRAIHRIVHDDYDQYGRNVSFNGMAVANYSYKSWINVYGRLIH